MSSHYYLAVYGKSVVSVKLPSTVQFRRSSEFSLFHAVVSNVFFLISVFLICRERCAVKRSANLLVRISISITMTIASS